MLASRPVLKYAVRVTRGRGLSPKQLVQDLQETGVRATLSTVLPEDFLVVNGLQYLIRERFLKRGDCQVGVAPFASVQRHTAYQHMA